MPSNEVVIVEEELAGIGNFVDLPRLMFVDEKCGNLKVVVDGGKFAINNNRNKKFYKPIDVHSVTNPIDEIEVSMAFLVVTFFCVGRW